MQAKCEINYPHLESTPGSGPILDCAGVIEYDRATEEKAPKGTLLLMKGDKWVGTVVQMGIMTSVTKCAACDGRYEVVGWTPMVENE